MNLFTCECGRVFPIEKEEVGKVVQCMCGRNVVPNPSPELQPIQRPPRSGIVTFIAVVNFVVAGLAIISGVFGLAMYLVLLSKSGIPQELIEAVNKSLPGWLNYERGKAFLMVLLGGLLLLASVGLLRASEEAQPWCLVYGLLMPCLNFAYLYMQVSVVKPAVDDWIVYQHHNAGFFRSQGMKYFDVQAIDSQNSAMTGTVLAAALFSGHGLLLLFAMALIPFRRVVRHPIPRSG